MTHLWEIEDGLQLSKLIERAVVPLRAHVALAGSVLYRGWSDKDIDIIIYQHDKSDPYSRDEINQALVNMGFDPMVQLAGVYPGDKTVYTSSYRGKRVDVFYL